MHCTFYILLNLLNWFESICYRNYSNNTSWSRCGRHSGKKGGMGVERIQGSYGNKQTLQYNRSRPWPIRYMKNAVFWPWSGTIRETSDFYRNTVTDTCVLSWGWLWLGDGCVLYDNGLCQLKVDVILLNTVKNELADVSCVSPSSEQARDPFGWLDIILLWRRANARNVSYAH